MCQTFNFYTDNDDCEEICNTFTRLCPVNGSDKGESDADRTFRAGIMEQAFRESLKVQVGPPMVRQPGFE